jgi:DNA helicase HerA-like ATPase
MKRICCSMKRPSQLLEKIEQVVRLIRSKGIGVYFITQNPIDIPDTVLGQLGNRIQHALRAYTPRDQRAVKISRGDVPAESKDQRGAGDQRVGGRRGAGFYARRGRHTKHGRTHPDPAARCPRRTSESGPSAKRW